IRSAMTVWYFHNRPRLGECHIGAAWADPSGSNVNKRRAKMEKKRAVGWKKMEQPGNQNISRISQKRGTKVTVEMLRREWARILGVDATTIPGIGILTAHTLFTEIGPDLSSWKD